MASLSPTMSCAWSATRPERTSATRSRAAAGTSESLRAASVTGMRVVRSSSGSDAAVRSGSGLQEHQDRIAGADPIAVFERAFPHRNAVDRGPVGAVEIAQDEASALQLNRAVPAGHHAIGNAQSDRRIAAEDRIDAIDWESLATEWAGQHDQSRAHSNSVAIKQNHCRGVTEGVASAPRAT